MTSPSDKTPLFQTLCVIGPGHIGSSILRRARLEPALATRLVTTDADPTVRETARRIGLADDVPDTLIQAVADADCVILCVPVGAMGSVAAQVIPAMKTGAILSDVGSTKGSIVADVTPHLRDDIPFVPAHPMAGREFSGPESGFPELFDDRWCLLTPLPGVPDAATQRVSAMWNLMGARTRSMDVAHHDKVCAMVSHLPHLLAFTICSTADDLADESRSEVLDFAASGFRDFTRIAGSNPVMWRDIFLNNREALLEMLARFTEDAQAMARAIRWGDADFIVDRIERGRQIRKTLIENRQA